MSEDLKTTVIGVVGFIIILAICVTLKCLDVL